MANTQDKLITAAHVARLFDLTSARISQLTSDGILCPIRVKGKHTLMYPQDDTTRRYIVYLRDKVGNRSDINEAKAEAELAKKELEIRRLEIQVAQEEGRVHDASTVEAVWNDIMGSFKMRLLSAPQTMAEKLVGVSGRDEMTEILRKEIYDLCVLLASYNAKDFYDRHPEYEEDEDAYTD